MFWNPDFSVFYSIELLIDILFFLRKMKIKLA